MFALPNKGRENTMSKLVGWFSLILNRDTDSLENLIKFELVLGYSLLTTFLP